MAVAHRPVLSVGSWSIGAIIAILVIVLAIVFAVVGRMDPVLAAFLVALGVARLT